MSWKILIYSGILPSKRTWDLSCQCKIEQADFRDCTVQKKEVFH